MKPFKTLAGAQKRAAFEQAHQGQRLLKRRYQYSVELRADGLYHVVRTAIKEPSWYVTTYCNHPHDLKTGKPTNHDCYTLPPEALRLEREDKFSEAIAVLEAWARSGRGSPR